MKARTSIAALALALLACHSGCNLLRRRPALEPTPIVFSQAPTLEQLATAVNTNTERVQTLQSRDARLLLRGLPAVSVEMTFEQPRRMRLRAGTGLTGQELDLGSNDELFWFWARQNPQPALFYARHDQFALSPNRSMLPIEPMWIIDALGLPKFDPAHRHEGPIQRSSGLAEIRSHIPSADGERTKVTVINSQYAWVMQQQVFDPRGKLIASATASEHEFFPHASAALPRKVEIDLPPTGMAFTVQSQSYAINMPLGDTATLFTLPQDQFPNAPLVDLADPRFAPPNSGQPVSSPAASYPGVSEAPRLRGYR